MSQSKTPKIRFPEFTEDWQKKRLDEIFTERKESCIISEEYPQLAFTIAEGVINPEDKKTNKRDFLIKDIETKKFAVTEVDDIIYNPANLKFGAIHRNKLKRGGVSPIYAIFSTEQLPAFMEYLVKRPSFIQESLKYLEGTVIKLMTLKPRDFLLMETYIPSIPEQEKIADLFTTLDSYIEIETKKTDSYKTLKASMLQKMFPQQGSLEPEIRFPGFTEPWEQRKLSDEFKNFIVPMRDKPKEFGGNIPWTRIEDIEGKYLNDSLSGQYVTEETINQMNLKIIPKDSLIVSSSATFGVVAVITQDLITNQTFIGLVPNDKETLDYWYAFFHSDEARKYMRLQSAGSTIFYIARESFENMPIKVPTKDEMIKIGTYFDNLDNLITLHQRKCEQLQLLKHALQQKMFV